MTGRETFRPFLRSMIQSGLFCGPRGEKSSNPGRPNVFTQERLIVADTIMLDGQSMWDDLAATPSDDMCPTFGNPWPVPPFSSTWLEAIAAEWDGETHQIGALTVRHEIADLSLAGLNAILEHEYGRGLTPQLLESAGSKPAAMMACVSHWCDFESPTAIWMGKTFYWLDPCGSFLAAVRVLSADAYFEGFAQRCLRAIRFREVWVRHVFANVNGAKADLVQGAK